MVGYHQPSYLHFTSTAYIPVTGNLVTFQWIKIIQLVTTNILMLFVGVQTQHKTINNQQTHLREWLVEAGVQGPRIFNLHYLLNYILSTNTFMPI